MKKAQYAVADAIREVVVAVEKAVDDGRRSRSIDVDDVIGILLSVADKLDPPTPSGEEDVVAFPCPECGESRVDWLACGDDKTVRCCSCGIVYEVSQEAS